MTTTNHLPSLRVFDYIIYGTDAKELRQLKKEVFTENSYYFEPQTSSPNILDIGAHIGVAVIFFHHLYPQSHIYAVEPHPTSFKLLQQNLTDNRITNVTSIRAATISPNTPSPLTVNKNYAPTTRFFADPHNTWLSTASLKPGGWTQQETTVAINVPAISFSSVLSTTLADDEKWDLVKMDVEGVEIQLLLSVGKELQQIRRLIVEAHNWSKQDYQKILAHLSH